MISYNLIISLNGALADANLHYRLHYINEKEAAFDPLGHCACEGTEDAFESFIKDFFANEGIRAVVDREHYRIKTED